MEMCWLVVTVTESWEFDQGPALFTAAAIKKMTTKSTTTAATFPLSKNCYLPSYKSRALQRLTPTQATRSEELKRQVQMRGAVPLTATGQYQAITLAVAQVSAPTTLCRGNRPLVFLTQCRRSNCPAGRWRLECLRSRRQ
jgi:hypothetical protein